MQKDNLVVPTNKACFYREELFSLSQITGRVVNVHIIVNKTKQID